MESSADWFCASKLAIGFCSTTCFHSSCGIRDPQKVFVFWPRACKTECFLMQFFLQCAGLFKKLLWFSGSEHPFYYGRWETHGVTVRVFGRCLKSGLVCTLGWLCWVPGVMEWARSELQLSQALQMAAEEHWRQSPVCLEQQHPQLCLRWKTSGILRWILLRGWGVRAESSDIQTVCKGVGVQCFADKKK